jgi:DNA-binding MarR family transcriptional regulator
VRRADPTQQQAWRAYLEVMRLLPHHLEDRLHARHDLTLIDYQVLVEVSEADGHRPRMSELARRIRLSKSRMTHQIGRMERAGLVTRTNCAQDRHVQWVALTDDGWTMLCAAAPRHVEDVRELFFDLLEEGQAEVLAAALRAVADRLGKTPASAPQSGTTARERSPVLKALKQARSEVSSMWTSRGCRRDSRSCRATANRFCAAPAICRPGSGCAPAGPSV